MRAGIPFVLIFMVTLLVSGCAQLSGMHIIPNAPDPVIGQWVSGEPPASDLHLLFYENQTWIRREFYLGQDERSDHGTWSRGDQGQVVTQSSDGNITRWVYDPTMDSIYRTGLPQRKYYRFKG